MDAESILMWVLAVSVLCIHLAVCVAVAVRMHRKGRGGWKWFLISLVITAAPAWVVLTRRTRPSADGLRRCPHCHRLFAPEEAGAAPADTCPRCGLAIDEVHLA